MERVPEKKIHEIWDILHEAAAIYQQARDEGIAVEVTIWGKVFDKAQILDRYLWDVYNTPLFFFLDTINQAIKCKITYNNYIKIVKCYGIKVEV